MKDKGLVHIYTGNGKGKTTAALGLAVRAIGAGKKVFIGQFVKGMPYAELISLNLFENITIKQFGRDCFINKKPQKEDYIAANEGLNYVKSIIKNDVYDIIILDEIFIALYFKLISFNDVKNLITFKNIKVELILTGRYAPEKLYELADLVTEMKEIKHYYNKGINARKGIEF